MLSKPVTLTFFQASAKFVAVDQFAALGGSVSRFDPGAVLGRAACASSAGYRVQESAR
ncbi:MAG: hypothetical protein ACRD3O_06510 [Terriglobia bacterium]